MFKPYSRSERLADFILRQVAVFLERKTQDPRLKNVSLTAVQLSADKKHATLFFTLLDQKNVDEISQVLNKASGFYRSLLAQCASLRYTPTLTFQYDASILYSAHLSKLIDDSTPPQ